MAERYRMFSVVLPEGPHPFPYRTRKLSPPRPMILLPSGSGKVGHCRVTKRSLLVKASRLSYFVPSAVKPTFDEERRWVLSAGNKSRYSDKEPAVHTKCGMDVCRVTTRSPLEQSSGLFYFDVGSGGYFRRKFSVNRERKVRVLSPITARPRTPPGVGTPLRASG